jgi:hypothetical protein
MKLFKKRERKVIIEGATFWSDGKVTGQGLSEIIIRNCRFKKGARIDAGGAAVELAHNVLATIDQVTDIITSRPPIEIKPLPGTASYREVGSKKNEEGN